MPEPQRGSVVVSSTGYHLNSTDEFQAPGKASHMIPAHFSTSITSITFTLFCFFGQCSQQRVGQLGVPEVDCWTLLDAIGTIGLLRGRISRICRPRSSVSHRTAVSFAWVVAGFSHMFVLSAETRRICSDHLGT